MLSLAAAWAARHGPPPHVGQPNADAADVRRLEVDEEQPCLSPFDFVQPTMDPGSALSAQPPAALFDLVEQPLLLERGEARPELELQPRLHRLEVRLHSTADRLGGIVQRVLLVQMNDVYVIMA